MAASSNVRTLSSDDVSQRLSRQTQLLSSALGSHGQKFLIVRADGSISLTKDGLTILASLQSTPSRHRPTAVVDRFLFSSIRSFHRNCGDGVKRFLMLTDSLHRNLNGRRVPSEFFVESKRIFEKVFEKTKSFSEKDVNFSETQRLNELIECGLEGRFSLLIGEHIRTVLRAYFSENYPFNCPVPPIDYVPILAENDKIQNSTVIDGLLLSLDGQLATGELPTGAVRVSVINLHFSSDFFRKNSIFSKKLIFHDYRPFAEKLKANGVRVVFSFTYIDANVKSVFELNSLFVVNVSDEDEQKKLTYYLSTSPSNEDDCEVSVCEVAMERVQCCGKDFLRIVTSKTCFREIVFSAPTRAICHEMRDCFHGIVKLISISDLQLIQGHHHCWILINHFLQRFSPVGLSPTGHDALTWLRRSVGEMAVKMVPPGLQVNLLQPDWTTVDRYDSAILVQQILLQSVHLVEQLSRLDAVLFVKSLPRRCSEDETDSS